MQRGTFKNVSCTLLVPGAAVTTYKPYGFLFNAKTARILHAATHDIGSATDLDGSLIAPKNEDMSLDELVHFIQTTPDRCGMNEVNANFLIRDLMGLFICKSLSASLMVEILVIQKMLKNQYSLELPVFIYDAEQGKLELYKPSGADRLKLLLAIKTSAPASTGVGVIKAKLVAPYLGYTVSDQGKIQSLNKKRPFSP